MIDPTASKPLAICVEDDPTTALLLAYNLEKTGFEAITVDDGASALQIITQARPQLVVLDWTVPRLSGIQLLRQLRRTASPQALPVLMVTGRCEKEDRRTALDHGANAFITKPFALSEFIDAAQRYLTKLHRIEVVAS